MVASLDVGKLTTRNYGPERRDFSRALVKSLAGRGFSAYIQEHTAGISEGAP
jgi:hypothetical protein